MDSQRPRLRGLIVRLAVYYLALALPALVLVETTMLWLEFREFLARADAGLLERSAQAKAASLSRRLEADPDFPPAAVALALESWLLRIERPPTNSTGADAGSESSYVLLELSPQPVAAAFLDPQGRTVAIAPADARWRPQLPATDSRQWRELVAATGPASIHADDEQEAVRRVLMPVRARDGQLQGALVLELRLPYPWRKIARQLSFEWPILVLALGVFALGSAAFVGWYVTRRLGRIARAAEDWRRGDFSHLIGDRSKDELGHLAGQLDAMAGDLKALLATRAQLATLNERQRLARNLHDTVKQKAFALNLQLATAAKAIDANSGAGERLAEARRLTSQIQHELAEILDELGGADDAVVVLASLLAPRITDWSRASGIPALVRLASDCALPPARADDVVRLVDEALANILRHSGARQVEVDLAAAEARWQLRIRDDGRGGAAARPGGMGIGNMHARAAQLPGGRLQLRPRDTGTEITLSWELQA